MGYRVFPAALLALLAAAPLVAQNRTGQSGDWITVKPTALVQLDGASFDENGGVGKDVLNLRRARVGVAGEIGASLAYSANVEFGGAVGDERGRLNALWLEYRGIGAVRLRAGILPPSQPLEGGTPSLLFLERAAPTALQRGLAGGSSSTAVALFANGARWTASAGLSGGSIYDRGGRSPVAANARLSLLARTAEPLVHLGANGTLGIRAPSGKARFSERGETRSSSERLVDTGPIEAGGSWALGAEAGAQWRQLWVQGEYYRFGIEREGVPDPGFAGWYVQAAWTLTGEPRRYRVGNGSFDVPEPRARFDPRRGHWGVLELGLRYSDLDLNAFHERSPSAFTVRGGEQRAYSLVLNWQPEEHVRLQAAMQQVETRRLAEEGPNVRRDFRLFSLRSQFSL